MKYLANLYITDKFHDQIEIPSRLPMVEVPFKLLGHLTGELDDDGLLAGDTAMPIFVFKQTKVEYASPNGVVVSRYDLWRVDV